MIIGEYLLGVDKEILRRDNIIRSYILGRTWDKNDEFLLIQRIINGDKKDELLSKYLYVYDYEWEVFDGASYLGKGDLVFTDGKRNFLVVECKYIDIYDQGRTARTRRTMKRKKIKEQTQNYVLYFNNKHSEAKSVKGLGISSEEFIYI